MLPLIEVLRLPVAPVAQETVEAGRLPPLVAAGLGLPLVPVLPHPAALLAEEAVLPQSMLGSLPEAPAPGLRPAAAARGLLLAPPFAA